MDNMTGLLVALMFVTVLTMGFGNILTSLTPLLKTPEDFLKSRSLKLWWIIVCLIILDAFWRCVDIFEFEDWNFAEFLLVIAGASLLFFASTALPQDDDSPSVRKVFFACLLGFHVWLLAIAAIFGSPGMHSLLLTSLMIVVLIVMMRPPTTKTYRVGTLAAGALTVLNVMT